MQCHCEAPLSSPEINHGVQYHCIKYCAVARRHELTEKDDRSSCQQCLSAIGKSVFASHFQVLLRESYTLNVLLKGPFLILSDIVQSYTFTYRPRTLCWCLDLPIQAFYIHCAYTASLLLTMTPAAANLHWLCMALVVKLNHKQKMTAGLQSSKTILELA